RGREPRRGRSRIAGDGREPAGHRGADPRPPVVRRTKRHLGLPILFLFWQSCGSGPRPDAPAPLPKAAPPPEGEIVFMTLAKPQLGPKGYEIATMNLDGSNRRVLTDNHQQE